MTGKRCVIIGASPENDISEVKHLIKDDDIIVCADGGYEKAVTAGLKPDIIIGDFDSAPVPVNSSCEVIKLPVMKDDTDTMFCIREFIRRGCSEFLLLGMTGGRPDHTVANYCALLFLAQRGFKGCIADEKGLYYVLKNYSMEIKNKSGKGFAVFPFGCKECSVELKGFLYEVNDIMLTAEFPLGASNTINSDNAFVGIKNGSALVMIYG